MTIEHYFVNQVSEFDEKCERGILIIAVGADSYLIMARRLVRSIRINSPDLPVAIITDVGEKNALVSGEYDFIIHFSSPGFEHYLTKLSIFDLSPFQETMFLDADSLVVRDIEGYFDELSDRSFTPVGRNVSYASQFFKENSKFSMLNLNSFPSFNGGLYYFKKDEKARSVFELSCKMVDEYDELGLRRLNGRKMDEAIFCAAMSLLSMSCFEDQGRVMRTPIGISGRLRFSVYSGDSQFRKSGVTVSPAVVHCCGEWLYSYPYIRDSILLERVSYKDKPTASEHIRACVSAFVRHLLRVSVRNGASWKKRARQVRRYIESNLGRLVVWLFYQLGFKIRRILKSEVLLDRLISDAKTFTFVQVGANDGVSYDDLYFKWPHQEIAGVVIEPVEEIFNILDYFYRRYPNVVAINKAIDWRCESRIMFTVDHESCPELPRWSYGVSSFDRAHLLKLGIDPCCILEKSVDCEPFMDLLRRVGCENANYLQIDAEGYDGEIIKMIDFSKFKPDLVKLERVHLEPEELVGVRERLKGAGYSLFDEGSEMIAYMEDSRHFRNSRLGQWSAKVFRKFRSHRRRYRDS